MHLVVPVGCAHSPLPTCIERSSVNTVLAACLKPEQSRTVGTLEFPRPPPCCGDEAIALQLHPITSIHIKHNHLTPFLSHQSPAHPNVPVPIPPQSLTPHPHPPPHHAHLHPLHPLQHLHPQHVAIRIPRHHPRPRQQSRQTPRRPAQTPREPEAAHREREGGFRGRELESPARRGGSAGHDGECSEEP